MKYSLRFLLMLLSFAFINVLTAQTAKSIGMQGQLLTLYSKAKAMGMSDNEIKNQFIKKGYPAQMVDQIKKMATSSSVAMVDSGINDISSKRDTNWVTKTPSEVIASPYFGYSFFNNSFLDYAPNTNIATPENYVLGSGDQLIIHITGLNDKTITNYINQEGIYTLPYAGLIQLNGLTIEAAKKIINQRLTKIYPAIVSGATKVYVSLGEVRTIQVMVTGEAQRPGAYTVSSLTNMFNLLYLSAGPTTNGSLRKIQLIRNNKLVTEVDFYDLIKSGLIHTPNIRLQDQDVIHYVVYNKRIKVEGEVKTPSIFELKDKETVQDVLNFAGGFKEAAYTQGVTLKLSGDNVYVKNLAATDFSKYILSAGDEVLVTAIDPVYQNRVVLSGEVKRAGVYGLLKDETLRQLIERAGGLKEDAFSNRGFIQRKLPGVNVQMLPFDTKQIMNRQQEDILLFKNDSVVIYTSNNFVNNSFVNISGGVKIPGKYNYNKGMKVEDLIAMAGGFTIDAANTKLVLSRLIKNESDKLSNQILETRTIQVNEALVANNNSVLLEPFDDIQVPTLVNYKLLGNVHVKGEVLYEGAYSIEKRDETILEIIERAGGITPNASLADIQVYRKGLRVGTETFQQSLSIQQKSPFTLLPGDSIYVPRKTTLVTVVGAVYNEQIVEHNSNSLMYYISAVGGVKSNASLKKAYVQYPNGMFNKTKHFLFFTIRPTILPGSKIIVPEKSLEDYKKISMSEVSAITAILTSMVAIYSLLKN
jgi:protein involved in polysaccharide export with SLBB domain